MAVTSLVTPSAVTAVAVSINCVPTAIDVVAAEISIRIMPLEGGSLFPHEQPGVATHAHGITMGVRRRPAREPISRAYLFRFQILCRDAPRGEIPAPTGRPSTT